MSNPQDDEADLAPTFAAGFKPGQKKSINEYATLDANDESLNRWKASLGLTEAAAAKAKGDTPKVTILSFFLATSEGTQISFNLSDKVKMETLKKNPVTIKEGVEYNAGMTFQVDHGIISGLRYLHVVKRSGIKVDKLEQMLGSYGPSQDGKPYTKNFDPEESPSGMIARSGTYNVRSRIVDDDAVVYADFEWAFKLGKEW